MSGLKLPVLKLPDNGNQEISFKAPQVSSSPKQQPKDEEKAEVKNKPKGTSSPLDMSIPRRGFLIVDRAEGDNLITGRVLSTYDDGHALPPLELRGAVCPEGMLKGIGKNSIPWIEVQLARKKSGEYYAVCPKIISSNSPLDAWVTHLLRTSKQNGQFDILTVDDMILTGFASEVDRKPKEFDKFVENIYGKNALLGMARVNGQPVVIVKK